MKKYFLNIFNASSAGQNLKLNKRLAAILVCFSIAAIFWFLIALSKEYSTSLSFPIFYINLPGQKVVVNDLPSSILLNVKTSGFKILAYHFKKEKVRIQIDVDSRIGKSAKQADDIMVIPTKTFAADFNDQLGPEINILNFVPDSIVFNFSFKSVRRVPVKADLIIRFEKQYDSIGHPEFHPDSVNISGPASLVNSTDFISTEPVKLEKIKEQVTQNVRLVSNRLLSLSDTVVKLILPVEKFTEENMEIPVNPVHVQKGYLLKTFPDKINVRYLVALSKYNLVNESSFAAVVDAAKITDPNVNKLNVEIISAPAFVKSIAIEPEKVEYILSKQ